MGELARRVDRRPATIRNWQRLKLLPEGLLPKRDERNHRYWTEEQVEGIKKWLIEADIRPGKGLVNYRPSPEEAAQHLEKQRKSKAVA